MPSAGLGESELSGGVEKAPATQPSEGFTKLFLRDVRLDLSVEYLVLKNPWQELFTPDQLAIVRSRLREHNFAGPPEDAAKG